MTLGEELRELRIQRKLTLQEVADAAGLSKSYISQMESDKANPSIGVLKAVMNVYGSPVAALFKGEEKAQRVVVKKMDRRTFGHVPSQIRYELLSPDLNREMECLLCTAEPGATSRQRFSHEGEEFGTIISGKLRLVVGDEEYILEEGDSVYFDSTIPHEWEVVGDSTMRSIWVITPPSF